MASRLQLQADHDHNHLRFFCPSAYCKMMSLSCYLINRGMGRFLAVLHIRTGDSTFTVVETNQFKHLSHLSLVFRQGNDSVIKQFLAGRLAEYKVVKFVSLLKCQI